MMIPTTVYTEKQQGNFRTLVDFRVDAGDVKLKEHLETMKRNETYLGKRMGLGTIIL